MRKLFLSDEILLSVEKPARYTGGEVNMAVKDPAACDIRFCMCFPDVYEVGMSHLGIQILYDMFNRRSDTYCERVYSPWVDLDKIMREKHIPLFSLETQTPIKEFDFLGITLQYEMCYTNILQVLDLSGIPLRSKDRGEDDPIVVGGGPCSYNPEPIADFFDFFFIGEGENGYDEVLDLYKENRANGGTRKDFLRKLSHIPGMYVPSLYEVSYNDDGTIAKFGPIYDDVPEKVEKRVATDLNDTYYPEKPVVPFLQVIQDRVTLEIQRGCIRGCRFCQAGMIYRPIRARDVNWLKKTADKMLKSTGHEEITLSSLSSSDYADLQELVCHLIDTYQGECINVALPSLRIDAFSLDVMSKVQDVNKSSITFAPEAGTQRMRNVINKGLTTEDILGGAATAFEGGWNKVKLYFMLGLPTETEEDTKGIAELAEQITEEYYKIPKDKRHGKVSVTVSTSYFIPKPFTPFQWVGMAPKEEFLNHQRLLKATIQQQLNHKSISYQWHDSDTSVMEGIFARGDRKLCDVIEEAYKRGCIYDAWTEHFRYDVWQEIMQKHGITIEFYNLRERKKDEILPWDFIDIGVTKKFLYREYERAQREEITPNCRRRCSGCGAAKFGCGVCTEPRDEFGTSLLYDGKDTGVNG
ncbi:MAG: TIGR03960 family B12-binding radical SAM protein [Lachnospiraceae bacterium]|nr:TIGR03960 family B12-binding radical SAM protein [Lachnospiraceae bacterium]